jgi:hypothetical protein
MEKGFNSQIKAASLVRDYLPFPPTPTNKACPEGDEMILVILQTCFMASSKSTKFISTKFSL